MSQRGENASIEFGFSYEFDGITWAGHVWASTWEEAEMKVKAMGNGKIFLISYNNTAILLSSCSLIY